MHIERLPAGTDLRARFSGLHQLFSTEGGAVYVADEKGAPVVITDESTLADVLGEYEDAIAVRRFDSRKARDLFAASCNPNATFKVRARQRQAEFRETLSAAARSGDGHPFLLGPSAAEENLLPALRGADGADAYFRHRSIRWWSNPASGDPEGHTGPTHNMTSSQIACVNLFLPHREVNTILTAMLQALDGDVVHVAPVPYTMASGEDASLVELEWTGRRGTLEGGGSRGAHATSADAALIGVTASGLRRLYLIECKYTEVYTTSGDAKGTGDSGDVRRARYANRYASSDSCLSGAAPLDAVLYEPFYQIVRLGMLADAARQDVGMHVHETRVVVLCPEGNAEYRTRITSPALASQFGKHTVEYIAAQLWRDPRGFRMADPGELAAAARQAGGDAVGTWSAYLAARYGW